MCYTPKLLAAILLHGATRKPTPSERGMAPPKESPRPRSAGSWLSRIVRTSGSRVAELEAELASTKAALADLRASGQTPGGDGKATARSPFDDTFSAGVAASPAVPAGPPDKYHRGSVIRCERATMTGARLPEGAVAELTKPETLQATAPTSAPLKP